MTDRLSEEAVKKAQQPYIVNSMYVHYDENGQVVAISNSKTFSDRYYEVPAKRVESFMLGKKDFTGLTYDYFKFDKEVINADKKSINANVLYMIPSTFEENVDCKILIDKNKKQLRFLLTDQAKKEIFSRNLTDTYKFYFTKKNNQHFLYNEFLMSGEKLLANSFFDIEQLPEKFSIYTIPVFNSYGVILK